MKIFVFLMTILSLTIIAYSNASAQTYKTLCRLANSPPETVLLFNVGITEGGEQLGCARFPIGDYPTIGRMDNLTSRIFIQPDVKALVVCSEVNFGGVCETLRPSQQYIHNFGAVADNDISSIKVLSVSVPSTNPKPPPSDPIQRTFPIANGQTLQKGVHYTSESGNHFLTLNTDGNLVVYKADGGYVWGFDSLPSVDHRRVARVDMQGDGNLAAYDKNNGYIWSALTENPDPNARLVLTPEGVLQIISPSRGVLWASDGNISAANPSSVTDPFTASFATGQFSTDVCKTVANINTRYPQNDELVADADPLQSFINTLNCSRVARNLQPIQLDSSLNQACQYLTNLSAQYNKLSHRAVDIGGNAYASMDTHVMRMKHFNYQGTPGVEAAGWFSPSDIKLLGGEAMKQWTDSSTHYRPFLSLEGQNFKHVGFGYSKSNTDPRMYYTCAVFGN